MSEIAENRVAFQRMIDALFRQNTVVSRLDVIIAAEFLDFPEEVLGIVNLLPPGRYTRHKLCDQLNSAITGHGWGRTLGTVE